MELTYTLDRIDEAVQWLLAQTGNRRIIAFHGELGAGKTTLISAICQHLKVQEAVSSPTFSIINAYSTLSGEQVFHLDLYRLNSEQEGIDAGVEDCLQSGVLCLVEWPERLPSFFEGELHCYISGAGNNIRKLRINS